MKRNHDSLLVVAAFVWSVMLPLSAQAQSAEPVAPMAGSSDTASANRRHGDVQNIGNRDVAGRIFRVLPNRVSLEQEKALGQQMATEFEQTVKLLKDPVIAEYVDRLGQNLVKHSDAKVPFQIKVVDADAGDVLALPGGFLYVNKGLILEAENEAELAGGMAHGIAHVCARHATQLQSKAQYLQLFNVSAGEAQAGIHYSYSLGGPRIINARLIGMCRAAEIEADQLGVQYLWNTGYDPHAFVFLLEKEQVREKSDPGPSAGWFRTYAFTTNRIAKCLEEERALPKKDSFITSSPEFDRIKARLLATDKAKTPGGSPEKK